jgi:hypothetical protein
MRKVHTTAIAAVLAIAVTIADRMLDHGNREWTFIALVALGGGLVIYLLTPYRFLKRDPNAPRGAWDPSQMDDDSNESSADRKREHGS